MEKRSISTRYVLDIEGALSRFVPLLFHITQHGHAYLMSSCRCHEHYRATRASFEKDIALWVSHRSCTRCPASSHSYPWFLDHEHASSTLRWRCIATFQLRKWRLSSSETNSFIILHYVFDHSIYRVIISLFDMQNSIALIQLKYNNNSFLFPE